MMAPGNIAGSKLRRIALAAALLCTGASVAFGSAYAAAAAGAGRGSGSSHDTQPYLGVELRDTPKDASANNPSAARGTEVLRVDHDGPAGKAGLRESDRILQFNGQAIGGHEQLKHLLRDVAPGQTVSLLVLRDGQQITLSAVIETRQEVERHAWEQHIVAQAAVSSQADDPTPVPTPPVASGFFHGSAFADASRHTHSLIGSVLGIPYTGLQLEPITPQLATFFGVDRGTGLLVRAVEPNSPAMVAGLHAGDVVIAVDQKPVATESEWSREMHESKGRTAAILIVRDHHQQTLTLVPDSHHRSRLLVPSPFAHQRDVADGPSLAVVARLGS